MFTFMFLIVISYIVFDVNSTNTIHPVTYPLVAPKVFTVTAIEPPGLYVTWSTILEGADNPVLGYKIKIWTIQLDTETKYELINGDQYPGVVNKIIPTEHFNTNTTAATSFREVTVHGSNKISHRIMTDIQYNVLYEVRLSAFNRDGPGPMTKPIRVQIVKVNGYYANVQRQESGCFVSVSSFVRGTNVFSSDEYPHIHYSYL